MSINFQSMQTKLMPVLFSEMPRFLGQGNFVASDIDEIPVSAKQGIIPLDLSDIAFNLTNDYGGKALGFLEKALPDPKAIPFKVENEDFYVGFSEDYVEDMSLFYENGSAEKGKHIVSAVAQKIANRVNLIRERNLCNVVSNASVYGTANTIDMSTTPVSSWTEENVDMLFKNITEATEYLNKATGGELWGKNMGISEDTKFHIVLSFDVWKAFQSVFRTFNKNYITLMGFEDGKYKAFRPDLFNAATGAITHVGTAYQVDPDNALDDEYKIQNLKNIWCENCIYLFTSSANVSNASSVKELVYKAYDLRTLDLLGDQMFKSRVRRATVASNPMAFFKIKIAL